MREGKATSCLNLSFLGCVCSVYLPRLQGFPPCVSQKLILWVNHWREFFDNGNYPREHEDLGLGGFLCLRRCSVSSLFLRSALKLLRHIWVIATQRDSLVFFKNYIHFFLWWRLCGVEGVKTICSLPTCGFQGLKCHYLMNHLSHWLRQALTWFQANLELNVNQAGLKLRPSSWLSVF